MASRTVASTLFLAILLAAPSGSSAPGDADPDAHRIGTGDVVDVRVWREPDLSGRHRVGVDGTVQHVLVGAVPAAGSTPDELAAELGRRLERDYLREARVAVTLVESRRRRASVLGAVTTPGAYPVVEETRVLDVLAAAGGLAPHSSGAASLLRFGSEVQAVGDDPPDESQARERIQIDLAQLLDGTDLSANHPVRSGDVLIVTGGGVSSGPPSGSGRIRVVGEVGTPGSFDLSEAPTLLDAVLAAGGLAEYASANRARLVRVEDGQRNERRVRLGHLLEGRSEEPNVVLQDGDLIVVPESFF